MPQAGHSFAHLFWEMERRVMQTIDKEKNKEFYEECGGGNNLTLSGVKNLTLVRRQRSVRRCAEVEDDGAQEDEPDSMPQADHSIASHLWKKGRNMKTS